MTEVAQPLPILPASDNNATASHTPPPHPNSEDMLLGENAPLPRASQEYCDAIMDRSGIIGS